MKKKITILTLLMQLFFFSRAQNANTFHFKEGIFKLLTVCEQLNTDHHLKVSYNTKDVVLQKEVKVKPGEYTIESLFNLYFRPNGVDYKILGEQIVVYSVEANKPGPSDNKKRNKVTFSGYVSDAATGERLQGATVLMTEQQMGTASN